MTNFLKEQFGCRVAWFPALEGVSRFLERDVRTIVPVRATLLARSTGAAPRCAMFQWLLLACISLLSLSDGKNIPTVAVRLKSTCACSKAGSLLGPATLTYLPC